MVQTVASLSGDSLVLGFLSSVVDAVGSVPLRAAPSFHVLLLCDPLWSAEQLGPCACLQMAFLRAALAIILVCVFKYSEWLPLGVLMFTKGLTGTFFFYSFCFLRVSFSFLVKKGLLSQRRNVNRSLLLIIQKQENVTLSVARQQHGPTSCYYCTPPDLSSKERKSSLH